MMIQRGNYLYLAALMYRNNLRSPTTSGYGGCEFNNAILSELLLSLYKARLSFDSDSVSTGHHRDVNDNDIYTSILTYNYLN